MPEDANRDVRPFELLLRLPASSYVGFGRQQKLLTPRNAPFAATMPLPGQVDVK
jgi:hypothetical protein